MVVGGGILFELLEIISSGCSTGCTMSKFSVNVFVVGHDDSNAEYAVTLGIGGYEG